MSTVKFLCFAALLDDCQLQGSAGCVLSFSHLPLVSCAAKVPSDTELHTRQALILREVTASQMEWIL